MQPEDLTGPLLTFEATLHIQVKAHSKMEAAHKLNVMFVSSAVGLRDYIIHDLAVTEDREPDLQSTQAVDPAKPKM